MPLPHWSPHYRGLSLSNYHIRYSQGSRLVKTVRLARIGGFDLMILTKTNITDKVYFQHNIGYDVVCLEAYMTADGDAQGGVGMISRNQPQG